MLFMMSYANHKYEIWSGHNFDIEKSIDIYQVHT